MTAINDLNVIHQTFDGIIPASVRAVAEHGTTEMVALIRARGELAGARRFVTGQIEIIRQRRADGSFYPALYEDLASYRRQYRAWRRIARELHAKVFPEAPAIQIAA
jgi:hypothetical protein